MSSTNKHTVVINGHNTSVFVEDDFWVELKKISNEKRVSISELISLIDQNKKKSNLSSAIRLYILNHLREI